MRFSIPAFVMLMAIPCFAANTVGDAVQEIMESHRQRMNRAREQFNRQANSSKKSAILKLVPFATAASRKGDAATATRVWGDVLSLDDHNSAARSYFSAIGRLDEILNETKSVEMAIQVHSLHVSSSGEP